MRSSFAIAALAGLLAAAPAGPGQAADPCLSPEEMREVVAGKDVVAPLVAVRAARARWPRAETLRAALCPGEAGMVYVITLLDAQGRFVQVTVDAASGKVTP